jgi:DDE family transposase
VVAKPPEASPAERAVVLGGDERQLRLVAVRKTPSATQRARRLAEREGRRHGGSVRPETLILAGYMLVLTNCQDYSCSQVLETYGLRWQIELAFKRLKTLLHLDHLRAHDPEVAQAYLLAKILAALLVEELNTPAILFPPGATRSRQVSLWRLVRLYFEALRTAVTRVCSLGELVCRLPDLRPNLAEPPRRRSLRAALN